MHIINEIGESQLLWNLREYVCSMVDPKKKASLPRGPFDVSKGALAQLFSLSLSPFFSVLLLSKQSLSQSARGFGTVNNRKPTTPVKRTVRTKTLLSCIHWRVLCKVEKLSNSMAAGFRCLYYQW